MSTKYITKSFHLYFKKKQILGCYTYKSESFSNLNIIYGSGRNSSFVIQGTHHVGFSYFLKDKSPEL